MGERSDAAGVQHRPTLCGVTFARPDIAIELAPKTGAREDFLVRVIGPGDTDYRFRLSITYTALGMWQVESMEAAAALAEVVVELHGTASAFPEDGFWFDSYSAGESLRETTNIVRERGWKAFLVPAARKSLGAELLRLLDELDEVCLDSYGRSFMRHTPTKAYSLHGLAFSKTSMWSKRSS